MGDTECKILSDIPTQALLPDKTLQDCIDKIEKTWIKSVVKVWKGVIKKI